MANSESIKKKLLDLFANHYNGYLETVEGLHTNDPIELEDFKERIYGDISSVQQVQKWPALAVLSGSTNVAQKGESGIWHFFDTEIELRIFVRDDNLTDIAKIVDRHIEALMLFFKAYHTLDGEVMSVDDLDFTPSETILPPGWGLFAKGLRAMFTVRHRG